MFTKKLFIMGLLFLALVVVFVFIIDGIKPFRYSKNLKCDSFAEQRDVQICQSIENGSEYTCCGHAIFSPGYRTTFETARRVWCDLKITSADRFLLERMSNSYQFDARLQNGGSFLLRILDGIEKPDPTQQDIFTPGTQDYILKNGCQK